MTLVGLDKIKNLQTEDPTIAIALKEITNEIQCIYSSIDELSSIQKNNDSIKKNDIIDGMNNEDKIGMFALEQLFKNPKTLDLLIKNKVFK